MKLSEIQSPRGSRKKVKRLGRGDASGHGGTSTRGHKGHKARSGFSLSFSFEGGQMPLARRVPKYGFRRRFKKRWVPINLRDVLRLCGEGDQVTISDFEKRGWLRQGMFVKVIGTGKLSRPIQIEAHAFSAKARSKIESTGGKAILVAYRKPAPVEQKPS
ncbi:MAG: 50S ribosomal protein L15 [Candidatus Omnitrophica bacterium]|nr:50S ribosomal protein L15 [Candidatus Omnitrophota bacterium]